MFTVFPCELYVLLLQGTKTHVRIYFFNVAWHDFTCYDFYYEDSSLSYVLICLSININFILQIKYLFGIDTVFYRMRLQIFV